jgi:hypothetical protein
VKLDRNIEGGHGNKYGLIKNRRLEELRDAGGHLPDPIGEALLVLAAAGVLDWGCTPETEFFAIRLKDKYAGAGLDGYAHAACVAGDLEYSREVGALAKRSGLRHPHCKKPD